MTPRPSSQDFRPSRRSPLAMVGAASIAGPGLLAGCSSGPVARDGPPPSGSIPDMEPGGSFHRLVSDLAAKDQFAGNVLVAHWGEPVLTASYGMADRDKGSLTGRTPSTTSAPSPSS